MKKFISNTYTTAQLVETADWDCLSLPSHANLLNSQGIKFIQFLLISVDLLTAKI